MEAVRRVSAFLFYVLGAVAIVSIVMVMRNIQTQTMTTVLNIIDLPLIFVAMLFGGTSFILSVSRERVSVLLAIIVFLILGAAFGFFAYLNFAYPFQVRF